jgi:DNA-binding XRE family transcriptional regulator
MAIIRLEINGKRYVAIPEEEYTGRRKTKVGAAVKLNPMPASGADGSLPALESARTSLANKIIAWRHAAGLTQSELAGLAGVRQETISRLESVKHMPGQKTFGKITDALEKQLPWASVRKPRRK